MDYSKTVHLPETRFPMKADLPKREPAMLEQWEKDRVYDQALKRRQAQKGKKQFILHDGPPYANGHLHLGHALNKILKDIIVRSKTMAGYYAPYVPGWDCHGLPIELQLMKELKITDKHKVDRVKFREQAKAFAEKFIDIQRTEFKRMGVLGDWDHPYLTMDERYKQIIVETFQALEKKGYVYRGKKPVYWCTVDETALAEAEVEYENDPGPSIYVAFQRKKFAPIEENTLWLADNVYFVIWTTTPWTLPANRAIAIHPKEDYVLLEGKDGKNFIVAERRALDFAERCQIPGRVLARIEGQFLKGSTAQHPWLDLEVPVLPADFVAMDTGTGIVHIAPGHGREDYLLGIAHHLEVFSPVDDRGRLQEPGQPWDGVHVFKANAMIMDFLESKGALIRREEITHSYPHCWRCHKPIIFRATEQWFLGVDKHGLRGNVLQDLNKVAFYPEYGHNRMAGMVEARPDWCLSRQRLWGTEIPGASSTKDPDIFDVWFESGVSWAAVLQQRAELAYPADMYLEGSDQHRGWFQTSLIPSVAMEGCAPFKSVLTHGFVMDGQGRPMSKSLGNVISPQEIIQQYGADVLRLWVAASDYGGDVRLSPEILKGLTETYRKIRNTFRYLLGNLNGYKEAIAFDQMLPIDQWALSKLRAVAEQAMRLYEGYEFHRATALLAEFCGATLSGFYLDVLKDRLYCDAAASVSRRSAQTVLYHLAESLVRLWAPILSFTCDEAWRELGHVENVAATDFPSLGAQWTRLEMDEIFPMRETVLLALEKARQEGRIKGGLEARVSLHGMLPAMRDLLKKYDGQWASLCIVSQASVSEQPPASPDAAQNGLAVRVERAEGAKCARCWIYKVDVGVKPQHPDICGRCAQAVDER